MDPDWPRGLLFLQALAVSLGVEVPVLFACVRGLFRISPDRLSSGRVLAAALAATPATLPVVWFVLPALAAAPGWYAPLAESFAVLAEAGIIRRVLGTGLARSLAASLLCNAASFLAGRFLWEPWIAG